MQAHLLEVWDKKVNTLQTVQQESKIDRNMTDVKTCTRHDSEEFNTWLLSIDKVSKMTGHDPKEFFTKAKGNLLKFFIQFPNTSSLGSLLRRRCLLNFQGLPHSQPH